MADEAHHRAAVAVLAGDGSALLDGGRDIDLNCDIGEGYGRWQAPADVELLDLVTTVNIAAGFHGGDPGTIRATVDAAVARGLDIGAHVALPDLMGFGRRRMDLTPAETYDICLYQLGAVHGFVQAAGGRLRHVKPHGALYAMALADLATADAIARAAATFGPPPGQPMRMLLLDHRHGAALADGRVQVECEGFPDLEYTPDGDIVIERVKRAWPADTVARRALGLVVHGRIEAVDGVVLDLRVRTLCLHSDAPDAAAVACTVRDRLTSAGVAIRALSAQTGHPSITSPSGARS